jgi:hypothetical protein
MSRSSTSLLGGGGSSSSNLDIRNVDSSASSRVELESSWSQAERQTQDTNITGPTAPLSSSSSSVLPTMGANPDPDPNPRSHYEEGLLETRRSDSTVLSRHLQVPAQPMQAQSQARVSSRRRSSAARAEFPPESVAQSLSAGAGNAGNAGARSSSSSVGSGSVGSVSSSGGSGATGRLTAKNLASLGRAHPTDTLLSLGMPAVTAAAATAAAVPSPTRSAHSGRRGLASAELVGGSGTALAVTNNNNNSNNKNPDISASVRSLEGNDSLDALTNSNNNDYTDKIVGGRSNTRARPKKDAEKTRMSRRERIRELEVALAQDGPTARSGGVTARSTGSVGTGNSGASRGSNLSAVSGSHTSSLAARMRQQQQ